MDYRTGSMIRPQSGPTVSSQIQNIASSMHGAGMMYPGGNPNFDESTGVMGSGAVGGTVPGASSPTADWFDANRPGGWAGAMDQNRQSAERMLNTPSPAGVPGTPNYYNAAEGISPISSGSVDAGVSTPTIGGPQWLSQMLAGLGRPVNTTTGSAPWQGTGAGFPGATPSSRPAISVGGGTGPALGDQRFKSAGGLAAAIQRHAARGAANTPGAVQAAHAQFSQMPPAQQAQFLQANPRMQAAMVQAGLLDNATINNLLGGSTYQSQSGQSLV